MSILNQIFDQGAHTIILLLPPSPKECNLNINKSLCRVHQKLRDNWVQNVLHTNWKSGSEIELLIDLRSNIFFFSFSQSGQCFSPICFCSLSQSDRSKKLKLHKNKKIGICFWFWWTVYRCQNSVVYELGLIWMPSNDELIWEGWIVHHNKCAWLEIVCLIIHDFKNWQSFFRLLIKP